jgi:hypothetical protein
LKFPSIEMDNERQREILGFSKGELEAVRDWDQILSSNAGDFPTVRTDSELSLGRDSAKTFADENFGGW